MTRLRCTEGKLPPVDAPFLPTVAHGALGAVPLLSVERPGRLVLELVFRVGAQDETLPTHGTTHLLEHLAASVVDLADPRVNAWTSPLFTGLVFAGTPREVAELVPRVVAAVHDPPTGTMERERRVLEAEEAHRGGWAGHRALAWRYGPRGPGLPVFREYGLRTADADRLRAWAAARFTAGNAVAWSIGPSPAGVRVELPDGPRRPPAPAPAPVPVALPAEVEHAEDEVVVSLVGADTPALRLGVAAARERALTRLRTELGLVYDVSRQVDALDGALAHGVLSTGGAEPARLREELLAAARAVAAGAAPDAVRAAVALGQHALGDPAGHEELLRGMARHTLLGREATGPAHAVEELMAVPDDEVAAAMTAALGSALVLVPAGTRRGTLPALELAEPAPGEGREHRNRLVPRSISLAAYRVVVAPDRVTVHDDEEVTTVRFADVEALVRLPGGAFDLVAADGTVAELRPGDVRDGALLARTVQEAVAPERVVPLGEREARVDAAAAGLSVWMVGDTPDPVAGRLARDEAVVAMTEAGRGRRAGVLVLTDRQLLFSGKVLADRVDAWPLAALEDLRVRAGPLGGLVGFTADGERVRIRVAWPKGARAFADALRPRRARPAPRRS